MTAGFLAPPRASYHPSHSPTSSLLASGDDVSFILEPSYRPRSGGSSDNSHSNHSCASLKQSAASTLCSSFGSDASAHDPEFRPFATPLSVSTRPRITRYGSSFGDDSRHTAPPSPGVLRARARTTTSATQTRPETETAALSVGTAESGMSTPAQSFFDLSPLDFSSPPTKEQREAARAQLAPSLRAALRANESQAEVSGQQMQQHPHNRHHSWLRRGSRHRASQTDAMQPMSALQESPTGLVPARARRTLSVTTEATAEALSSHESTLVSDESGLTTPADADAESDDDAATRANDDLYRGLRQRVASLTLKVDLALFRAKKRVKRRVGIE